MVGWLALVDAWAAKDGRDMVKTPEVLKTEKKLKVTLSLPRKSLTLWGVLAFLRGKLIKCLRSRIHPIRARID